MTRQEDRHQQEGAEQAHRLFRFGVTGWKVQAELPNPVNVDAATAYVTAEDMRRAFGCGPDVEAQLAAPLRALGPPRCRSGPAPTGRAVVSGP